MTIEYTRLKAPDYCRVHKCMRVWVNKICYDIHYRVDGIGFSVDGPLPNKKDAYASVKEAVEHISKNAKQIEHELKERQTHLPL